MSMTSELSASDVALLSGQKQQPERRRLLRWQWRILDYHPLPLRILRMGQ